MATIEEIKRVSGPRAKRVPIIGSRVLYGLCNGTLPDGVDYATWRKETGAKDLGYGGDGAIVVWEFPANAGKGGIVCIGSGCYDWHTTVDASSDRYHKNVETMTMNAINYLMNK